MADWHPEELRAALEKLGWRIAAELPSDYRISGSWVLRRAGDARGLIIDFDGIDDLRTLPMSESYACTARGTQHSLYFSRRGVRGSNARKRWQSDLAAFVKTVSRSDDDSADGHG